MSQQQSAAVLQSWEEWERRVIGGKFELSRYVAGSERSAIYETDFGGVRAAVKMIAGGSDEAQAQLARWELARRLNHPHIVRVFDTGFWHANEEQDMLFAVMEYGEENLADVLADRPLAPEEARRMLQPALEALAFLHGRDMICGNIKPSNIFAITNQVKLASDGVRHVSERRRFNPADRYAAPEAHTRGVSREGDVWSLGMTVVEALTRALPSLDPSSTDDPRIPGDLPEPFASIAVGCLRGQPGKRASVSELRVWLDRPIQAHKPPKKMEVPQPASQPGNGDGARPAEPAPEKHIIMSAGQLSGYAASLGAAAAPGLAKEKTSPQAAPDKTEPASAKPSAQQAAVAQREPGAEKAGPSVASAPPLRSERDPFPRTAIRSEAEKSAHHSAATASVRQAFTGQEATGEMRRVIIGGAVLLLLLIFGVALIFRHSSARSSVQENQPAVQQASGAAEVAATGARRTAAPPSPGVTQQVMPNILHSAQNTIHGTIKLSVLAEVNAEGQVSNAKLQTHGPSKYFAQQSLRAAEQWKFAPPLVDGKPVASRWMLKFEFKRSGNKANAQMLAPRG